MSDDSIEHDCGTIPTEPIVNESTPEYEGICLGHVDILFLLTPEEQNWIAQKDLNSTYLYLLMTELSTATANSNIGNTFDYTWASFEWNWAPDDDTLPHVRHELSALTNDTNANLLRDQHNADRVVLFSVDPWDNFATLGGCAAGVFLDPSNGYAMLKIEYTLKKALASHEIGHLLRGEGHNDHAKVNLIKTDSNVEFPLQDELETWMAVDIYGRILEVTQSNWDFGTFKNIVNSNYTGIYFIIKTTNDGKSSISKHISF